MAPLGARAADDVARLSGSSTLADYLRIALKQNPGLVAEYERYKAAKERIPQAKSLPDPRIGDRLRVGTRLSADK